MNGMTSVPNAEYVPPARIFSTFKRHKLLIAGVTLVITTVSAAAISQLKPYYDATTTISVGTKQASFHDLQATLGTQDVDAVAINTQVGVLTSPAIALNVTRNLHLDERPEFRSILDKEPLPYRLKRALHLATASAPLSAHDRVLATSLLLMGHVKIINDGRSAIINVTARTPDASLSASIANAYAQAYFEFQRQNKIAAIRHASALLDEQLAPLRNRLFSAEQAVEQYQEQHGMIALQASSAGQGDEAQNNAATTVAGARLEQMNRELVAAQSDLMAKQSQYEQTLSAMHTGRLDSSPGSVASPLIQSLRSQQVQLNGRIASLNSTALDNNPELIAARAESARISAHIASETGKIAESSKHELDAARARVDQITQEMDTLQSRVTTENQADVKLRQLQSEATAARMVYRDYLGRLTQTSSEAALQEPEADLISAAQIPLGASGPPKARLGALVFILALGAGLGAALIKEKTRSNMRTLSEMEGTEIFGLGMLPLFSGTIREQFKARNSLYLSMSDAIRGMVSFRQSAVNEKVIVITSAEPAEGKTTFAVTLAASIGRRRQRALIIDCDARRPSLSNVIGLRDTSSGLHHDVMPGVDVFILHPDPSDPLLLNIEEVESTVAKMRPIYDTIILDAPPVLVSPDAGLLAASGSPVIMVTKWHHTPTSAVKEALRVLRAYHARILGGVFSQVRLSELSPSEGGRLNSYSGYYSLSNS
ncbi:polysaccharide biosynthesis tyrosine autokinase [Kozakia baliensis]|uniref:GumC family protein n=1 Tax=Kozakia baliensis TaxID=153496 RepID=UPI00345C1F35